MGSHVLEVLFGEFMTIGASFVMDSDISQLAVETTQIVNFTDVVNVAFPFLADVELLIG